MLEASFDAKVQLRWAGHTQTAVIVSPPLVKTTTQTKSQESWFQPKPPQFISAGRVKMLCKLELLRFPPSPSFVIGASLPKRRGSQLPQATSFGGSTSRA